MKIKFDANQDYQKQAVQSVVKLFEGQPLKKGVFDVPVSAESNPLYHSMNLKEKVIANQVTVSGEQLLKNLNSVREVNGIPPSDALDGHHFTVEMETGTGKTYVYLRTIYELNRQYGFSKFVIVVPSIAIREGTLKNLEITHEHFQNLYGNPALRFVTYDSKKLTELRNFAVSRAIQIIVINIDSFAKDQNIINQERESGIRPIEYIQAAHPIVIVDEPQNMETEKRKTAIDNLKPAFTLRYSATHKSLYNLVYRLTPVDAYDIGLVKQIAVSSVVFDDVNMAYVKLEKFNRGKRSLSAKISININDASGVKRKSFSMRPGDDLYQKSNKRDIYKNRFILNTIDAEHGYIEFSNGVRVYEGNSQGGLTDEIMKQQIRDTIQTHFEREKELREKEYPVKVLSLFFIDKVANYRQLDEQGNTVPGKFAQWFEEAYDDLIQQPEYENLYPFNAGEVHNGYFSQDNKGKLKDTSGNTLADNDTFRLIMKNKERLLSEEEPLRFIFSHSALREGWDNPNVFQICTLNETRSDMKKRQEIGRGLRLPVDANGERKTDKHLNKLVVIANETYDDFASQLQKEIEEETGVQFDKKRIKDERKKRKVKLKNGYELDEKFLDIWNRIKHKTIYRVDYNSQELVENAARIMKDMAEISSPRLHLAKADIIMNQKKGVQAIERSTGIKEIDDFHFEIPDIFSYIQEHIHLTKETIFAIIQKSGRINDLISNPQVFLDYTIRAVKGALHELMISGIKYEKIAGQEYEMRIFKDAEINTYLSNLFEVTQQDKTLYNYIWIDSENPERKFAEDCENREDIEFYFKLPPKFTIPTPIGTYNPDWALIMKNEKKLYFVAETKSTLNLEELREKERLKIKYGEKHFAEFEDVEFKHVTKVSELIS